MSKKIDMTGRHYGRLTIIKEHQPGKHRRARWVCGCDCGKEIIALGTNIRFGQTKSCGCFADEVRLKNIDKLTKTNATHGVRQTRMYHSWNNMIRRCYDVRDNYYKTYGAVGRIVCDNLRESPKNMFNLIGERPDKYTLDRIDNNENYTCGQCPQCVEENWPMNIRWSTRSQNQNNRSNTIFIELNGVRKPIMEWVKETGLSYQCLVYRLKSGWPVERVLTT